MTKTTAKDSLRGIFPALMTAFSDNGIRTDAVTALVRFLDYRNASGAVCTGITWLSAGYLMQSTTSAPLQLVPVMRVDTDVYSYYVNIISGEVSRVSA